MYLCGNCSFCFVFVVVELMSRVVKLISRAQSGSDIMRVYPENNIRS